MTWTSLVRQSPPERKWQDNDCLTTLCCKKRRGNKMVTMEILAQNVWSSAGQEPNPICLASMIIQISSHPVLTCLVSAIPETTSQVAAINCSVWFPAIKMSYFIASQAITTVIVGFPCTTMQKRSWNSAKRVGVWGGVIQTQGKRRKTILTTPDSLI